MVFEGLLDGWQKDDMMPIFDDWACNWTCKLDLQNRGLRHTRALKGVNTLFVVFFDGNLPLRSKSFVQLHLIIYRNSGRSEHILGRSMGRGTPLGGYILVKNEERRGKNRTAFW